eukprot:m.557869 g.557869  ORF g.557869 m.557869 type:complete len:324 (+) comp57763_c0_seq4:880-1851(+)
MTSLLPCGTLAAMLQHPESIHITDTRDPLVFSQHRIRSAVSFTVPKMVLRRVKSQELPKLEEIALRNKEEFARRQSGCMMIVYDASGIYADDITQVLLRCLVGEGRSVMLLEGGFAAFSIAFPDLCVRTQPLSLPSLTLLPLSLAVDMAPPLPSANPLDEPPSQITPFLAMSGERHAQNPALIREWGITHVLNLTRTPFNAEVRQMATCLALPMDDRTSQSLLPQLTPAFDFIEEAKRTGGKVLVHCYAGISRSAAVTVAYFMWSEGRSLDDAYEFVREHRSCISPNLGFMGQLAAFGAKLQAACSPQPTVAANPPPMVEIVA